MTFFGEYSIDVPGPHDHTRKSTHVRRYKNGKEKKHESKEETRPKRSRLFILVSATGNDGNDVAYYEPIV